MMRGEDEQFWKDFASLLISMVCLIEREKLRRKPTTSELRAAGKEVLRCNGKDSD